MIRRARHRTESGRRRAVGPVRLGRRQFGSDPWVSVGLALLIALVALLLTAVPRGLVDVQSRQLVQEIDGLSAAQRDVVGQYGRTVNIATQADLEMFSDTGQIDGATGAEAGADETAAPASEDAWAPFREGLERERNQQSEPLRSVLGTGQMLAVLSPDIDVESPVETGYAYTRITAAVDPDLEEHVTLVDGDWPALTLSDDAGPEDPRLEEDEQLEAPHTATTGAEVMLLDESAEALHLEIGDAIGPDLVLAGTYTPVDPDDPRWQHVDNAATLGVIPDPDAGDTALATAFLNPQNRGSLGRPASVQQLVWYPVDPTAIAGRTAEVEALRAQLTGFLSQQHVIATGEQVPDTGSDQIPVFASELTAPLDRIVGTQRAATSLLAVIAAGPLGVAVAVAALGARLVVHRRRPALTLALARGASPAQVRWVIAAEGLLLGIPAAALGHLAATLLLPGPTPWWQWAVTAVVALVPSVTLAASVEDTSLLQRRSDLSGSRGGRWRWVAEVGVVALAAVAAWRLLDRGSAGTGAGIDLLAAGTPVLLALAACVVTLRLYPFPLAALTSALRQRPTLTPFLGAARSLRDPAGGLVPTLAVVLGTAIALISGVLLGTVTRGAEVAAWESNGAALRVTGPPLTDALRQDLEAVAGVEAVGGIADSGASVSVSAEGVSRNVVRLWVVDDELQQVQSGVPDPVALPAELFDPQRPAALLLRQVTVPQGTETMQITGVGQTAVLGHLDRLPGAEQASGVAVARSVWENGGGVDTAYPRTILVGLAPGADPDTVAAGVDAALEGRGSLGTVAEQLERFTDAPVTRGMVQLFVGATMVSGVLTVLSVIIVQLMGSHARARLLATLRTLGLAPRQTRALTAWELAPLLVTSVLVGALLGLAVPWVLLRGLDLTGLTGGGSQPALVLDPLVLSAVLGGVVLTVLIAVTVSAGLAGRTNLAQALRVGEER